MARRLGRYDLETRLATSATSEVWVAREADAGILATKLAVKLLWSELAADAGFLAHFLAEAKRAAQLRHPNIVQIRDLAEVGGEYFTVMELVPGESLRDVVTQLRSTRQPMPVGVALRVAADAARALHAAHVATDGLGQPLHLLHKGLRPSNLLLGYDGRVKLTDFGTASVLLLPQLVALKSRVHPLKYAYLSPEQCLHTPLDARSDIFALGVILWELLAGRRLFDQTDEFAVKQAVMQAIAPPPSRLRADVPPAVDAVLARALQRSPAARFSTAAELADALEEGMRALPHRAEPAHVGRFLAELFPDRRARWRGLVSSDGAAAPEASGTLLRAPGPRPPGTRSPTKPRQRTAQPPPAWQDRTVDEPAPPRGGALPSAPALAPTTAPASTAAPGPHATPAPAPWGAEPSEPAGQLDVGATLLTPTEIPPDALASPGRDEVLRDLEVPEPARGAAPPADDATMEDAAAAAGLAVETFGGGAAPSAVAPPADDAGPTLPGPMRAEDAPSSDAHAPWGDARGALPEETLDVPPPGGAATEPSPRPIASERPPAPELNAETGGGATTALRDEEEGPLGVSPPHASDGRGPRLQGAPTAPPPDGFQPDIFAEDPTPEGPWAPSFRLEDSLEPPPPAPKGAKLGPLTASVLREHGELLVGETSVRAGGKAYAAVEGKLAVRIKGRAQQCEVRVPPEFSGEVVRAGAAREAIAGGSALLLRDGDVARLAAGDDRFIIRALRPPAEPRGWDLAIPVRVLAVALALSLVMHVVLAVSVGVLQESGVIIPVEKPAPAEKFAQARVRKVKSLRPHKKKKPKRKRRIIEKKKPKRVAKRKRAPKLIEKPPDPSEAPAKVPNAVRKRLSKAMTNRYAGKSRKERVKSIFKTPHAGSATTFKQAVSNVRSVTAKGASSAFRIAGSETHLPGGGVNLAVGGGGEQGPVTKGGDAVGGSVKKLAARAKPHGGKVRGQVRGLRAAARVTGTLSRSEVLKVIGRHTRAIQRCYEKQLMSKPGLSGKITFAWTITPTGKVSGARQRTSTMGSAKVSSCILKVIRRMKFPKPKGGSVTIVYPFIFRSSS